jgi:hypothetical protein
LQSLPPKVQKQIEDVRASCREYLSTANRLASVSSGDDGLETFTVSGLEAVMINELTSAMAYASAGATVQITAAIT